MMTVPHARADTNLPIPRFASLRSSEVNLRTGPGVRYPVEWVFVRKEIPVEIIAEFDHWRKIRDWIGSEGWVHRSMLSGKRMLVITEKMRALREKPSDQSPVISHAEAGVFGKVEKCAQDWCRVTIAGMTGWLKRTDFWGVYPTEEVK